MPLQKKYKSFSIGSSSIEMRRSEEGLVEIIATNELEFQKALGFAHAIDRIAQMLTSRAIGDGKISEIFSTKEILHYDILARKLKFYSEDADVIEGETKVFLEAYCEGVNTYLSNHTFPALIALFGKIEPWTPADIFRLIKVHMYLGMAQNQEKIEKLIIQAIKQNVPIDILKKLFFPHLQGLNAEIIDLIHQTHLADPFLETPFNPPSFSNNWVVSTSKSESGFPVMCFDPHLIVNHLPSFWYEVVAHLQDDYRIGVTIPGMPALIMGRSKSLSASFTYGMMDTIDFFIEECKEGHYKRGEEWIPLLVRKEEIKRKGLGTTSATFYETDLGVLETSDNEIQDGKYFCLAWSGMKKSVHSTFKSIAQLWNCKTVAAAQNALKDCQISCNWLLADQQGNIGYQQTGNLPNRSHSGLFPLPGWESSNRWDGFVTGDQLKSIYNPECGFLFSANEDQNVEGKPLTINVPFADYRSKRIEKVLSGKEIFSYEELKQLQADLYSEQAARFIDCFKESLPDTQTAKILQNWDLHYEPHSKGASLFDAIYTQVLHEVFGKNLFGVKGWEGIVSSSLFFFLHGNFDAYLLKENSEDLQRISLEIISNTEIDQIQEWGEKRKFWMKHILLGKIATKILKNDTGPLILPGSLATVAAGHFFLEGGREIVVGQSYRFCTDMATDFVESALAGGSSGQIFSPYFTSDVKKWIHFEYKKIDGNPSREE